MAIEETKENIIKMMLDREERGLSLLYDMYASSLLGIVSRIVKNKAVAEEVLQNVFLKAWNNIDSFNASKGTLFTWLVAISRNAALDQIRLKGYQVSEESEAIEDQGEELKVSFINANKIDVERLLSRLNEKNKEVLDLLFLQGNSQQKVADILDIPLGTVKSRLRLAMKTLRTDLKNEEKLFLGAILILALLNFTLWV